MSVSPSIRITRATIEVPGARGAPTLKHYLLSSKARTRPAGKAILKDVTLEANAGERIGVIGRNGSGKSTLLKMIAGIYPLASGQRDVRGLVTAVLSPGVGLDGEASLRHNVRLGLAHMNLLHAYSADLEDDILEFSELTDRAGEPFKVLSSGMKSRLAFSISLFHSPHILLLDEVFATGDAAFVHKATSAMRQRLSEAPISFLISHDNDLISDICNRVLLIQDGFLIADGAPADVIDRYRHSYQG